MTDRFVGQGLLVAVYPGLDGGQVGLRPAQRGLGIVQRRLKRGGVNLVEVLAFLDIGPLREQAFEDQTVDLRPDIRDQKRRGAAGQLGVQRDRLPGNGHGCHFRHHGRRRLDLALAGGQQCGAGSGNQGQRQRIGEVRSRALLRGRRTMSE